MEKKCKYAMYNEECIFPDDENCIYCLKKQMACVMEVHDYLWKSFVEEEKRCRANIRLKDS